MRIIAVLLCGVLAACSQTNGPQVETKSMAQKPAKSDPRQASASRCNDAVAKVQKQQANAAMLGGALSMVGGLGGFGGNGGAIAAQAVSYGGSMMQAKAQNDLQGTIEKECLS